MNKDFIGQDLSAWKLQLLIPVNPASGIQIQNQRSCKDFGWGVPTHLIL